MPVFKRLEAVFNFLSYSRIYFVFCALNLILGIDLGYFALYLYCIIFNQTLPQ